MPPRAAAFNHGNAPLGDTIFLGNGSLFFGAGTDFFNILNFEFLASVSFAKRIAPFIDHILDIVSWGANTQMSGVYAGRIIANMQYHLSRLNFFSSKMFIRKTMGASLFFSWQANNAISVAMFCAHPQPAPIRFIYATFKGTFWSYFGVCRMSIGSQFLHVMGRAKKAYFCGLLAKFTRWPNLECFHSSRISQDIRSSKT